MAMTQMTKIQTNGTSLDVFTYAARIVSVAPTRTSATQFDAF